MKVGDRIGVYTITAKAASDNRRCHRFIADCGECGSTVEVSRQSLNTNSDSCFCDKAEAALKDYRYRQKRKADGDIMQKWAVRAWV